ncbi:efflux RND transporter periplasmic adaptor subunit [Paenibacillus oenotherae]|uniref:Efflux RND transporter periplasmic adaptor subunit n=1 Tax=Paenibacillus oenotherae TaxID=1435645 RepID=A0ABS7D1Y6_9BACL|nr:efflux RND transporter periplasmic adaptor subunit [Paenibacillus oenotherae]MBW7473816.1 efflux RND transporter periplasmic adaptor subunit [Paenibacillus oenotherae]
MKKWIWMIVIVLVGGGIVGFLFMSMNQPVEVALGKVSQQSMAEKIYVSGKLEAKETTALYSDVNALVKQVKVKVGDQVKKGQVLLTLNVDSLNQQLETERINLELTQAERLAAKRDHFNQTKKQRAEQADAKIEPLNLEQYDLRIKNHYVTIRGLEKKLAKDEITANADGTVTELSVNSGQMISEGMQIVKVSDLSAYQVVANINEIDAGKVALGMEVDITGESFQEVYQGKVAKMAPIAVVTDPAYKDAFVATTVALDKTSPELRSGYNVNIELEVPDQLRIVAPLTAIVQSEGKSYAYKLDGDRAVKVEVQTGKENDEYLEITSGVEVGDQIVVEGTELLEDGAKVAAR